MAETEKFYEREIDRTNYRSFWYLSVFLIAIISLPAYGLFELGNTLRHTQLPTFSAPNPKQSIEQAKQVVSNDISKASDSVSNKANDQASGSVNTFLKK